MVLQEVQSERLLGVDKQHTVAQLMDANGVDLLAILPLVVVAVAGATVAGSANLLFMKNGNRTIEIIANGIHKRLVDEISFTTWACALSEGAKIPGHCWRDGSNGSRPLHDPPCGSTCWVKVGGGDKVIVVDFLQGKDSAALLLQVVIQAPHAQVSEDIIVILNDEAFDKLYASEVTLGMTKELAAA